ncbi:hypothetical protein SAMN04489716_0564 [Actinoplanes derwentensis]|uniref:Uncharacterized protein n=2 Tax=Actinoplanes derwentensis TaxID=113562 RepID=A0A1H1RDZ8_9ACTN|nr:hypothetical protein Ade03nite_83520 [Actinoplanes derwentensis]SDS33905.1 hypothetical protein SAMN04489716_0564 [Actinoplanes derwentensis]
MTPAATLWARLSALLLVAGQQLIRILQRIPAVRHAHEERERRHLAAVEAQRWADEVRVAASRADEAAERWQEFRQHSEEHAEAAWLAWQEADRQLDKTRAAAAFRTPDTLRTTTEFAARERFLHRAVAEAVERGDLPATVATDLSAGEGGWNPRLHPVEQELVLHRAIAAVRYHLYRQAVDAEESAQHDARLAAATRDSLRREVSLASGQAAAQRHHLLPEQPPATATTAVASWVQRTA